MASKIYDCEFNNDFFDLADEVIQYHSREDVTIKDPEFYMKRLSEIQSPRERLTVFFKSQLNFNDDPTHEAVFVRSMGISGLAFGWLFGGISKTRNLTEDYQRRYNAAVFDGHHRMKRQYVDTYVYTTIRRGAKYGVGSFLLCTSAGIIGLGSITYRNQLYMPDWLVGFAALGAASRSWLGLRGIVAGAGLGVMGGLIGYGVARASELFTGRTMSQLRYLNHMEYLKKREATYERIQRHRKRTDQEMLDKIM